MINQKLIDATNRYGKAKLAEDSRVNPVSIHMYLYAGKDLGYDNAVRIARTLKMDVTEVKIPMDDR